jgi:hypothetical protein
MLTTSELNEYMAEIRSHVCTNCVERRAGGPPCEPLGKLCGVEQHLAPLIDAIHSVRSESVVPYRDASRRQICDHCTFRHSSVCPCPMDYLHVLIVQAVEAVDARHERLAVGRQRLAGLGASAAVSPSVAEIRLLYEKSTGVWTGCDWPTELGKSRLDLNGWTAERARKKETAVMGADQESDWHAAADWLAKVEQVAQHAEEQAALAVRAASAGEWREALEYAREALASEFATGRAVRRGSTMTWHRLFLTVEAAIPLHPSAPDPCQATFHG